MKNEVLSNAIEAGVATVQLGVGIEQVKESVADALEDGVKAAKRVVKRGRRAAEDLFDEAEHQIKRHPLGTVGFSFAVGLGLGAVLVILLARNEHRGN